jgi:hypothetical protein
VGFSLFKGDACFTNRFLLMSYYGFVAIGPERSCLETCARAVPRSMFQSKRCGLTIQSTVGNFQSTVGNIRSTLGNIQSTVENNQSLKEPWHAQWGEKTSFKGSEPERSESSGAAHALNLSNSRILSDDKIKSNHGNLCPT